MTPKRAAKKSARKPVEPSDATRRLLACLNAILERKARDIVVLRVTEVSSIADYLIICSGTSDRQVQAIAATIQEKLKKAGILPLGVEGEHYGHWILIDFNDVVVHVFYEPVRALYQLERIWADVPRMDVAEDTKKLDSLTEEMWH